LPLTGATGFCLFCFLKQIIIEYDEAEVDRFIAMADAIEVGVLFYVHLIE
jgi:hypothetical protein